MTILGLFFLGWICFGVMAIFFRVFPEWMVLTLVVLVCTVPAAAIKYLLA